MPLPAAELDRIAAVLNANSTPRPAADPPGPDRTGSARHHTAPMSSTQPPSPPAAELYQSLLAARQHARQRLQTIADIERAHRHTPLASLADLAVSGALEQRGLAADRERQP